MCLCMASVGEILGQHVVPHLCKEVFEMPSLRLCDEVIEISLAAPLSCN